MDDPVEDGGGQGVVVGEGFVPVLVGAVGGDDGGVLFVAAGEDLEELFGADFIDGQVAEFVKDE
jgi:hypothetical protein